MQDQQVRRLLGCAGLWTAIVLAGCGRGNAGGATTQAAGPKPVAVTVMTAKSQDLERSVRVVGSLAAVERPVISNRVTGTVSKVFADVGDKVKPGAVLVEIGKERFALSVRAAEGALQETLAKLGLKDVPGQDFAINQTAPVKRAQSELDNATQKITRAKGLYEQKVMKEFEFLDIESAFKVAESNLQVSRDEARSLLAKARQDKATMELRQKDLTDAVVTVPDGSTPDGVQIASYSVTMRTVSSGEYLREGTNLFTLVADGMLKLQARVPERYLASIAKDAKVTFKVEAYPKQNFEGTVRAIDPSVDPASRTFLVEALVNNDKYGGVLRPGSFVQGQVLMSLDDARDKNRVMVPLESITSFVGVNKVYVIVPGKGGEPAKVKAVDVTTGQQEGNWLELEKAGGNGIHVGDQVVISGMTKLVDGSKVEIQSVTTSAAATSTSTNPR